MSVCCMNETSEVYVEKELCPKLFSIGMNNRLGDLTEKTSLLDYISGKFLLYFAQIS